MSTLYDELCDLAAAREERNSASRASYQSNVAIEAVAAMQAARILMMGNGMGMTAECLNLSGTIGAMCAYFDIDAPTLLPETESQK